MIASHPFHNIYALSQARGSTNLDFTTGITRIEGSRHHSWTVAAAHRPLPHAENSAKGEVPLLHRLDFIAQRVFVEVFGDNKEEL